MPGDPPSGSKPRRRSVRAGAGLEHAPGSPPRRRPHTRPHVLAGDALLELVDQARDVDDRLLLGHDGRESHRGCSERPEALGTLPHEAGDAAPVPDRPACEEALVGHGLVMVDVSTACGTYHRSQPALSAVGEVDLLAVEPVALVEAAELVEQLSAEEEGRRRAASRRAPARSGARRAGSGGAASCGLSRRRSGVRRTIVPRTVGNPYARAAAAVGVAELGAAIPQRGCASAKSRSAAMQPPRLRCRSSTRRRTARSSRRLRG